MSKMLITRPNHDTTTAYLSKWSEHLINAAKKRRISYSDFKGQKASRGDVEKYLMKQNSPLAVFNGHGSDDTIFGHKNEALIKSGENEHLLKSKAVYSVSCSSAKVLGPKAVSACAKCFIGYNDVFIFASDKNCSAGRELDDELALPFLDSSNQIVLSLLNGRTSGEAYEKSQAFFRKWIEHFGSSAALPGSEAIVSWLIWDRFCQKIEGDKNVCID
ncbi:MAG: hypothetical protein ABIF85_01100 [Nanoarchaeota archaeon]|nr:hypothetical protein [Nanoarchaeota archaeon]MBU4451265.1 hypothetical protein [Nanoarchaeota archaeon]MCG2723387.1 hypothetical protein [archaeon]